MNCWSHDHEDDEAKLSSQLRHNHKRQRSLYEWPDCEVEVKLYKVFKWKPQEMWYPFVHQYLVEQPFLHLQNM